MEFHAIRWHDAVEGELGMTVGAFRKGPDYRTTREAGTDTALVILTLEGRGRFTGREGQVTESGPGQIMLYDPGAYHNYGTSPDGEVWELLWCHFPVFSNRDYWSGWETCWPGLRSVSLNASARVAVANEMREVFKLPASSGRLAADFALNCLERAWIHIALHLEDRRQLPADPRLGAAVRHIADHLDQTLSLELLARLCGLSVSRFSHLFREKIGETPQAYIESRRMELARSLLRFSDLSVAEVARRCGYESPFYFSTRFRRRHRISPREFRRAG